jgi:hypothetical protein
MSRLHSILLNRYAEGAHMDRHSDHNYTECSQQIVSILGDFDGGCLQCHDGQMSKSGKGVLELDGNEVKVTSNNV